MKNTVQINYELIIFNDVYFCTIKKFIKKTELVKQKIFYV